MADYDLWIRLAMASPLAAVDRPLVGYLVQSAGMAHGVRRSEAELLVIEEKYRRIRAERGVDMRREAFLWYFGSLLMRQGLRLPAARVHLELAGKGNDRRFYALMMAATSALWPGVQHVRDHHRSRRLSPAWQREAEEWIAPLRIANARTA